MLSFVLVFVLAACVCGCRKDVREDGRPADASDVRAPVAWPEKNIAQVLNIVSDQSANVSTLMMDIEGAWIASPRLNRRLVEGMSGRLYFRKDKQIRLVLQRMGKTLFSLKSTGARCTVSYPGIPGVPDLSYAPSNDPPPDVPIQLFPDDLAEALDLYDSFQNRVPMMVTSPDVWRLFALEPIRINPKEDRAVWVCRKVIEVSRQVDVVTAVVRCDSKGNQFFACRFFEFRPVSEVGGYTGQIPHMIQIYYPLENTQIGLPVTKVAVNKEVTDRQMHTKELRPGAGTPVGR